MNHASVASMPPASKRAPQRQAAPGQFQRELKKAQLTSAPRPMPRVAAAPRGPAATRLPSRPVAALPAPTHGPRQHTANEERSQASDAPVADAPFADAPPMATIPAPRLQAELTSEVLKPSTVERFSSLTSAAVAMVERIERFLTTRLEPALNLTFRDGPIRSARIERVGRNGVRIEVAACAKSQHLALEQALRKETASRGLRLDGLTVR